MDMEEEFSEDRVSPNSSSATRSAAYTLPLCFPCCHEPETGEMAEGTGPDDLKGAPRGLRGGPKPLPAQPVKRAGCFWLFLG